MGAIIAEAREIGQIEELMEPIRDMFSAVFFVSIGLLIEPKMLADYAWPILVITLAVVFGKIFACSFGAFAAGQDLQTSLRVGMGFGSDWRVLLHYRSAGNRSWSDKQVSLSDCCYSFIDHDVGHSLSDSKHRAGSELVWKECARKANKFAAALYGLDQPFGRTQPGDHGGS